MYNFHKVLTVANGFPSTTIRFSNFHLHIKLGSLHISVLFHARTHLLCMVLSALILCPLKRLFKEVRVAFIISNNVLLFADMLLPNICIPWTAESAFLNIQCLPIVSKCCIRKQNRKRCFCRKNANIYKQKEVQITCCDTNRYLSPVTWSSYCIYFFPFYSLYLQA